MANQVTFLKTLAAASATNIAASQAAVAGTALTLTATPVIVDAYSATNNTEPGRQVLLTSNSGAETAAVLITGTNSSGSVISETVTFPTATTVVSVNNYATITQLLPSGTIVGNLSAGTNGVGATRWITWNCMITPPFNLAWDVELVSGAVNFTVQYTQDDPNNLLNGLTAPQAISTAEGAQSATIDGTISTPIVATRVLINSGTGVIRVRQTQAGMG